MTPSTVELMNKGMACLTEHMGIVDAEQFISVILRERFDYTKWQRSHFDNKTPEEISREAVEFDQTHPFIGNATHI